METGLAELFRPAGRTGRKWVPKYSKENNIYIYFFDKFLYTPTRRKTEGGVRRPGKNEVRYQEILHFLLKFH